VKASLISPIAKLAMTKPSSPPYNFEFILGQPSGISSADLDIIKLTAQYTAVNGREFLGGLAQREQRNPQFDFLKPTHLLFSYFTSLVDAYSKV
jgi:splicing factor 3A subunit 1